MEFDEILDVLSPLGTCDDGTDRVKQHIGQGVANFG